MWDNSTQDKTHHTFVYKTFQRREKQRLRIFVCFIYDPIRFNLTFAVAGGVFFCMTGHRTMPSSSTTATTPVLPSSSFTKDSFREATAGALAGAITKTLTAPLDRLKLVVQLRGSLRTTAQPTQQQQQHHYQGPVQALRRILQQEGFWALWRGNVPTLLINGGTAGLNFLFLDWYKKAADRVLFHVYRGSSLSASSGEQLTKSFLSGFLAGATAISLLYPLGVLRTKLALDVGRDTRLYPRGMRDVLRQSIRINGITSLYKGYGVALASVSLYRMVHLGGYDYVKTLMESQRSVRNDTDSRGTTDSSAIWGQRFLVAQGVSMTASTVHYPLDSIRRRLMMQADHVNPQYRHAWDCATQIYRQEGVAGYFRGLGTNYIRSVSAALLLVSYDFFNEILRETARA